MNEFLLDTVEGYILDARDAFFAAPTNVQIAVVVLGLMLLSRRGRALLKLPFWVVGLLLRPVRAVLRHAGSTRAQRVRAEWNRMRPEVAPKILARDDWTCQERGCGVRLTKDNWSIDHVIPVSRGGSNNTKNLRACCISCNSRKGARIAV